MRLQTLALVGLLSAGSLRTLVEHQDHPTTIPTSGVATVASLGHNTLASSGVWMRTVDLFTSDAIESVHITQGVRTATALDPAWRIPWVYGALMLQDRGEFANQEALLLNAIDHHPNEAWFPYALGMSRLEHHNDPVGAADWLDYAASMPGSPDVHAAAADALRGLK